MEKHTPQPVQATRVKQPAKNDSWPCRLPSGRTISVKTDEHGEKIQIHSLDGELEVCVMLTEQGPVLRLSGARLQIDSNDAISVNCRRFDLTASEGVHLHSGKEVKLQSDGEIRMKSAQQTFIDGDYVNLNCLDRQGYHDYQDEGESTGLLPDNTEVDRATQAGSTAPPPDCCAE